VLLACLCVFLVFLEHKKFKNAFLYPISSSENFSDFLPFFFLIVLELFLFIRRL
jgi:hypothetical protein